MAPIFNVSPHRSGTMSFHAFCRDHGLRSSHWLGRAFDEETEPTLDKLDTAALWRLFAPHMKNADVFSDLPAALLYREAYKAFPDAKFVLVRRTPESWVHSVRQHIGTRDLGFLEKFFYWTITNRRCATLAEYSDAELVTGYGRLIHDILFFWLTVKANFIVARIDLPTLGESLADFMGFEQLHPFARIHG